MTSRSWRDIAATTGIAIGMSPTARTSWPNPPCKTEGEAAYACCCSNLDSMRAAKRSGARWCALLVFGSLLAIFAYARSLGGRLWLTRQDTGELELTPLEVDRPN